MSLFRPDFNLPTGELANMRIPVIAVYYLGDQKAEAQFLGSIFVIPERLRCNANGLLVSHRVGLSFPFVIQGSDGKFLSQSYELYAQRVTLLGISGMGEASFDRKTPYQTTLFGPTKKS